MRPSKSQCRLSETPLEGHPESLGDDANYMDLWSAYHNGRSKKDGLLPTQQIAQPDCTNSAEETTNIIRSDSDSLNGRGIGGTWWRLIGVDLRESVKKDIQCEQTSHYTLIISKEEEVEPGDDTHRQVEAEASQAVEFHNGK